MSFEYVLNDISYANVLLYSATLPSYKASDKDGKKKETIVNANDPKNKDEVWAIIHGYKF